MTLTRLSAMALSLYESCSSRLPMTDLLALTASQAWELAELIACGAVSVWALWLAVGAWADGLMD